MKILKVEYGETPFIEWARMAMMREFEKTYGYRGTLVIASEETSKNERKSISEDKIKIAD